MLFIFSFGVDAELRLWFPAPLGKGMEWIMLRAVDVAAENEDSERVIALVDTLLTADGYGRRPFRRGLAESLREHLSQIKLPQKK